MALRRPGLQEFSLVEFTWTRIEGRTPTRTSAIEKKNELKKLKLVYSSKINTYELIGLHIGGSRSKVSMK